MVNFLARFHDVDRTRTFPDQVHVQGTEQYAGQVGLATGLDHQVIAFFLDLLDDLDEILAFLDHNRNPGLGIPGQCFFDQGLQVFSTTLDQFFLQPDHVDGHIGYGIAFGYLNHIHHGNPGLGGLGQFNRFLQCCFFAGTAVGNEQYFFETNHLIITPLEKADWIIRIICTVHCTFLTLPFGLM